MKKRIRRRGDADMTEQFVFLLKPPANTESPEWEDAYEFRYKGEMYDVIEKKTEGDKLIVRCINDKKEKELIDRYQKASDDDFGRNKGRSFSLLKLFNSAYTPPAELICILDIRYIHLRKRTIQYSLPSLYKDVQTPPPRLAA